MNKHLTGVVVALFAATVNYTAPAQAHHRPGNVVVMGGTVSQTGRYVEPAGRQFNGVKLYVDELNESGGLLGHKVELKIYDDKANKRPAIEGYEKLITEDKVDLVLGPYGSALTDPAANVMERYRQPFVAACASDLTICQMERNYVFSVTIAFAPKYQNGALHLAKLIGV